MFIQDEYGRSVDQYQTIDITVCGKETVIDRTPGIPLKFVRNVNAIKLSISRVGDIFPNFLVTFTGADTNSACVGMVFEVYEDAACTTPLIPS
jgi:hypothetical protein